MLTEPVNIDESVFKRHLVYILFVYKRIYNMVTWILQLIAARYGLHASIH